MKETEGTKQTRKARAANGTRTQRMTTFRLDAELEFWLQGQPNKGRYINDLIARDMRKQLKGETGD